MVHGGHATARAAHIAGTLDGLDESLFGAKSFRIGGATDYRAVACHAGGRGWRRDMAGGRFRDVCTHAPIAALAR